MELNIGSQLIYTVKPFEYPRSFSLKNYVGNDRAVFLVFGKYHLFVCLLSGASNIKVPLSRWVIACSMQSMQSRL